MGYQLHKIFAAARVSYVIVYLPLMLLTHEGELTRADVEVLREADLDEVADIVEIYA